MAAVRLRPIQISDAEMVFRWISDPLVGRFLGLLEPARTLEQERSWISNILVDKQHQCAFVIEDERGVPIGTCGLRGIDRENGTALFGIMIGETGHWDKGYGTTATEALLTHAFTELDLGQIRLSCHGENHRAVRCYEKAGFRHSPQASGGAHAGREEVQMTAERVAWLSEHGGAGQSNAPAEGRVEETSCGQPRPDC
jgi:RimJ/RimL family protein N-acetyltransferase